MRIGETARLWNVNPLVVTIDDFLTAAECSAIIELARGRLKRASVINEHHRHEVSAVRSNRDVILSPRENPPLAALCLKLGALLRMPFVNAEGVAVLHYSPGQQFQDHCDGFALDRGPDYVAAMEAVGGQRLFTTLCYLNDVEEGGATAFPVLGTTIAPKRGRLLVFANTLSGTRDATGLATHAGTPVSQGEKWAATVWWRERAWNPAAGAARDKDESSAAGAAPADT